MKFDVLQDDIDKGEVGDPHSCPIALALIRQLPNYGITVGSNYILTERPTPIENQPYMLRHYSPHSAHRFVIRFDKGKSVKPFSFDLDMEPGKLGKSLPLEDLRATSEKR